MRHLALGYNKSRPNGQWKSRSLHHLRYLASILDCGVSYNVGSNNPGEDDATKEIKGPQCPAIENLKIEPFYYRFRYVSVGLTRSLMLIDSFVRISSTKALNLSSTS